MLSSLWKIYEEKYKKLILIPLIILAVFSGIIIYTKITKGEYFYKDISLKGGSSITFYTNAPIPGVEDWLNNYLGNDAELIVIRDTFGNFKGYDFRTTRELTLNDVKSELSILSNKTLAETDFSLGVQSASIASGFFQEFAIIMLISFALMAVVAFYYFRSVITVLAGLFSTVLNIVVVVGVMDLLQQSLSVASIGAILIIIGLSADTDILLANAILLNKDPKGRSDRLKKVIKTELTISIAAISNSLIMFLLTNVETIHNIALMMLIGSTVDMISTMLFSAGFMRLLAERKTTWK